MTTPDALRAALAAVATQHVRGDWTEEGWRSADDGFECVTDGDPWPCTAERLRAVAAALAGSVDERDALADDYHALLAEHERCAALAGSGPAAGLREFHFTMWDDSNLVVTVDDEDPGDMGEPRTVLGDDDTTYVSARDLRGSEPCPSCHKSGLRLTVCDDCGYVIRFAATPTASPTAPTRKPLVSGPRYGGFMPFGDERTPGEAASPTATREDGS